MTPAIPHQESIETPAPEPAFSFRGAGDGKPPEGRFGMQTGTDSVALALPKGSMQAGVLQLLEDAGLPVVLGARAYRPRIEHGGFQCKLLKPQNIVEMLHAGSRDLGFTGADWVAELDGELVPLLDTGLDPVRIVAAAPESVLERGALPQRPLVVASEYERLTRRWMARRGVEARFVRSCGATEVFPPEDADCIVDNTRTGATLLANDLVVVDALMRSSTRLYASRGAMEDPGKRRRIEDFVLLIRSVLDARQRVMLEVNVGEGQLEAVVGVLPSMREPTIASLHRGRGFAVKAAVPRRALPALIPELKASGGTDIVISRLDQIIV